MGNHNSDASEIILEYICPILGTLTANVMFLAPVRDVYRAVRAGQGLGTLNPTPWAVMLGNTIGWITYGLMLQNPFVILANAPGMLISIWLNLQAVKLQYQAFRSRELMAFMEKAFGPAGVAAIKMSNGAAAGPRRSSSNHSGGEAIRQEEDHVTKKDMLVVVSKQDEDHPNIAPLVAGNNNVDMLNNNKTAPDQASKVATHWDLPAQDLVPSFAHDALFIGNVLLWFTVLTVLIFADVSSDRQEFVVGLITNGLLVIFYAGPLSTIGIVLRHRNAATIHGWTMLTNTLNGLFWAAYGFAVSDHFISVPNALGAGLGGIQMVLYLVFPRTTTTPVATTDQQQQTEDENVELGKMISDSNNPMEAAS